MELKETFNLTNKHSEFINVTQSTKGDDIDFSYYQDYYLHEKWINELSHNAIKIINERIDDEILSYLSYKKITHNGK
jgi:hypothetical protein